jgi:hypothetical protein
VRSATRKKVGKDSGYLEWLHSLPCVVCFVAYYRNGIWTHEIDEDQRKRQVSRTEAAHVGDRGLSQKCPDREAIPLCRIHHRISPQSVHGLQKKFWPHWGIDRDKLVVELNRHYDQLSS